MKTNVMSEKKDDNTQKNNQATDMMHFSTQLKVDVMYYLKVKVPRQISYGERGGVQGKEKGEEGSAGRCKTHT